MENHKFNWLSDTVSIETPNESEAPLQLKPQEKALLLIKEYKGPIIFALILFVLSLASPSNSQNKSKEKKIVPTVSALVSMWPIAKGEEVNISHFKAINLRANNLSKNQRLQLFDAVGVNPQKGERLIAKKDIPPNKPVFWSDLTIKKQTSTRSHRTKIHYGSERAQEDQE